MDELHQLIAALGHLNRWFKIIVSSIKIWTSFVKTKKKEKYKC
jgi:hypothetical protein